MDDNVFDYHTDADIPISAPVDRIVSLVPAMTESLIDVNLGDKIVAVTDICVHPEYNLNSTPRVGKPAAPEVEQIIALGPGVVFASQEENRREDIDALVAAGIPVWTILPKTVEAVFNLLWDVMSVFDETAMVPRIRLIEYTHDWVRGVSKNKETPDKVFVPLWLDPLITFNGDTYAHDLLHICGVQNVFAGREGKSSTEVELNKYPGIADSDLRVSGIDKRYLQVTLEEVAASQPDVILFPTEPYKFTEADIPFFAALDVPAAHNGRISLVDGTLLLWYGTRISYALRDLPPLLYPDE